MVEDPARNDLVMTFANFYYKKKKKLGMAAVRCITVLLLLLLPPRLLLQLEVVAVSHSPMRSDFIIHFLLSLALPLFVPRFP